MTTSLAALAARLALSAEGAVARKLVLSRHAAAAKVTFPKATVTSVGSFAQGTSLNGGDLDVVVHIPNSPYRHTEVGKWATWLMEELVTQQVTSSKKANVLKNAQVPILTYTDLQSDICVDVSFLPNSITNTEYVRGELELRPYMRTMLILLKYWLKSRNMNKTFTGGLGSYALSLTVIGYFNVRKKIKARKVTQEEYEQWIVNKDMYHLLIDYLAFWSSEWKYAKQMLEPHEGGIYKKGSAGHCGCGRTSLLAIADPTDPKNDVGSKAWRITALRRAMKLLRDRLIAAGPDVHEDKVLELLETTGKMFPDPAVHEVKGSFKRKGKSYRAVKVVKSKKLKAAYRISMQKKKEEALV